MPRQSHHPLALGGVSWRMALLAAVSVLCASINLSRASASEVFSLYWHADGASYIALEILCSFPGRSVCLLTCALALVMARPFGRAFGSARERAAAARGASTWVLPALFALACTFGTSFDKTGSAELVVGGIAEAIKAVLYCGGWFALARVGLVHLYMLLDWVRSGRRSDAADAADAVSAARPASAPRRAWRAYVRAFDARPFAVPACTLAVLWLPCLIGWAPGLFMWDTSTQILQWFGLPNHISSSVHLLDPGMLVTQHHPPVHTALMGLCVQAGLVLAGSETLGIMLYTCLQYALAICSFAFAASTLRRLAVPRAVRLAAFGFIALVPAFSTYALLLTKDTLFAAALLVLVSELAVLVADPAFVRFTRADALRLAVGSLGVTLLRSSAVFVALGALLAAAACCALRARRLSARDAAVPSVSLSASSPSAPARTVRGRLVAVGAALAVSLGVQVALGSFVYPALGVTPASKREMLSIPFQQVARYMRDHRSEVTHEEFLVLDEVLDARNLDTLYNSGKSDPVKATFREDATSEELAAFFKLWASWFARDPGCFISATAANYYGYFYAGRSLDWSYTSDFSRAVMVNTETNRMYSDIASYFTFEAAHTPLSLAMDGLAMGYRLLFQRLPGLTFTMQAALYDWALVLGVVYAWRTRSRRMLVLALPVVLVLLMALIGPCNATYYFRYAYPVAVCIPFIWALLLTPATARGCRRSRGADAGSAAVSAISKKGAAR